MTPVLVTPPTATPVGLSDLRAHLRVYHTDEDARIEALQAAAVAWLDGWTGVLGRAIMPQTWQQDFTGPGPHLLALPDAVIGSVTLDGDAVDYTATLRDAGLEVTAPGVEGTLRVVYSCALPAHRLPAVQAIICMMVAHWFQNREAVSAGTLAATPMAVDALIGTLRWRRL